MTKGSKRKLHQSFSKVGSLPPRVVDREYSSLASTPSLEKLHLLVQTARCGSKGDKEKGKYIEMYSSSAGKYDMRPTQGKAYKI
jgi:hypothetical protein